MKKIAYILPNLDTDGGQAVVSTLVCNLDKSKYNAKLFVMAPSVKNKLTELIRCADIEIIFCDILESVQKNKLCRLYRIVRWLSRQINTFSPDIIHVHLDTLYSWIYALIYNRKIIFTVHSQAQRIYNIVSANLFKIMQRRNLIIVTAVSRASANQFKECFGATDVKVIFNPVDIKHFKSDRARDSKSEVIFVNVARFNPVKNHEMLIKAFRLLIEEESNVRLILIGEGEKYEEIKDMVNALNLTSKVDFRGEMIDVSPELNQADVFVLSSLSEALPVSVIEAMAAGLPIISTNVGGLHELVTDNGILVEPSDELQLMKAMKELADNVPKRVRMGGLSEKYAQKFEVHEIVTEYEKIYGAID